jgi:hypothetical protein
MSEIDEVKAHESVQESLQQVLALLAKAREDGLVFATITELLPSLDDPRLFEAEHLVMIGVRQFVQHHPRHPQVLRG